MQSLQERQFLKEREIQMQCQIQKYELDYKNLENESRNMRQTIDKL